MRAHEAQQAIRALDKLLRSEPINFQLRKRAQQHLELIQLYITSLEHAKAPAARCSTPTTTPAVSSPQGEREARTAVRLHAAPPPPAAPAAHDAQAAPPTLQAQFQEVLRPVMARLTAIEAAVASPNRFAALAIEEASDSAEVANSPSGSYAAAAARAVPRAAPLRPPPAAAPPCAAAPAAHSHRPEAVILRNAANDTPERLVSSIKLPMGSTTSRMRSGDALVVAGSASEAAALRCTASAAGLSVATPVGRHGVVVHYVSRGDVMLAPTLTILSYNLRRSPDVWTLLSNHTLLRTSDILLLQEPPPLVNIPPDWVLLDSPPGRRARSVALVRQKWDLNSYAQVVVASSDVVALDLRTGEASVRVVGVYNPNQHDRDPAERGKAAREVLPPILESTPAGSLLVVAGDFNLHHPEWDPEYAHGRGVGEDAEQAQLTFVQNGLVHLLAPSMPTYKYPRRDGEGDQWATLDLVLGDLRVEARVVSCGIDERLDCLSDHQPLRLTLALEPPAPAHRPRRLFCRMQPEMLRDELATRLGDAPPALVTRDDVDAEAVLLTEALSGAIESGAVPLSRPRRDGRPAHVWWSAEISALHQDARRKERRAHRLSGADGATAAALEAKVAKSRLKAVIRREKRRHEKEEFDGVTDKTLWATVRRVEGRGASATTPPLRRGDGTHATSPQDKLALLQPVLLPEVAHAEAPAAEPAGAAEVEVEVEVEFEWPSLQEHEVRSVLLDARPYAAVGPDGIPNVVLQATWDVLAPHLVPLYAASLALGHLPASWRDGTGVVLRKPKKPDYSETRAYRLIAFGRCVSKLLEAVVARRLSYMGEHGLWPIEHVGGRRGRSAEDAVTCFVDEIQRQQRHGNIVVGVALDVAKAFPSVRTDVLLDDLRKGGVPRAARSWVESFMSARSCTLVLEGVSSEPVEWRSGLPQGSPLSPALFLTYNADLLRACRSNSTMATGWIDDINLLAWGKSVSSAVDALNARMSHLEKWSRTHHSAFEATKTTAVVFRPRRGTAGARTAAAAAAEAPPIVLDGVELAYADEMTMLGARIDAELTFDAHRRTCASRAAQAAGGVALLARARVGLSARHTRSMVRACVYPKMLWMAGVWWDKGGSVKVFESVQRTCARLVTGGYSLSALAAL
ncbi:hypothetical protein JCM8208_004211, partial [Rhodotorula glutinis]